MALKQHSGRDSASRVWRFEAPGPFTARHSAAQTALLELLTRKELSVEMITQMEKQAIFEARRALAEALIKCGGVQLDVSKNSVVSMMGGEFREINVIDVFAQLTAEQIDMVIEAIWDALRASMMRQSATGDIPFPLDPPSGNGSTSIASQPESGPPPPATGDELPPGHFRNSAGAVLTQKIEEKGDPVPPLGG